MKKLKKQVIDDINVGILAGIGGVSGSVCPAGTLSGIGTMMPMLTTVQGAGAVMRQVHKLPRPKARRWKRR